MPTIFEFKVSDVQANQMASLLKKHSEEDQQELSQYEKWYKEVESCRIELDAIKNDCSKGNWEGMDELPITAETVEKARDLLFKAAALPNGIPLPSLTPTSSGLIEMEWYKERGHRFAIRLNGQGVFIYSGLLGIGKDASGNDVEKDTRGRSILTDEALPDEVKDNLSRLFNILIA
jgi:hypothetical protein